MVIWRCGDVNVKSITDPDHRPGWVLAPAIVSLNTATTVNNNTQLKLVGSLYLTEIKQVHSEDDKIIIIDTFEGCLAASPGPGIIRTSLIPVEEVELHHRIFPPMKCTIVVNKHSKLAQ